MKQSPVRRCVPFRAAPAANQRGSLQLMSRRLLLLAALPVGLSGCDSLPSWLGGGPRRERLSPQAAKLVRWIHDEGRDSVLDPAAPRIMGMDNGYRDIPVRQLAANTPNGRYVLSLTRLRGRTELIFHRREGDYLYFHLASASLVREASATYPRNGAPGRMSESYAASDYPRQANYWIEQAELRART
jgi:hypothetical protein